MREMSCERETGVFGALRGELMQILEEHSEADDDEIREMIEIILEDPQ